MVDRRLLIGIVAIALASSSGCLGVHVGAVAGRVVDAETGQGVAGVELFRTYPLTQVQVIGEVGGRNSLTPDWTTSGADGEFEFLSRWVFRTGSIDHSPLLSWIHPDYGWDFLDTERVNKSAVVLRLHRNLQKTDFLGGSTSTRFSYDEPCFIADDEAYRHCKRVVATLRGRPR